MSSLVESSPSLYLAAITLISPILFAYTIAFTDSSCTLQRASVLLLAVVIAGQLQYSLPLFTGNRTYDGIFMSMLWIFHLRAFDLLLWKAVSIGTVTVRQPQQSAAPTSRSRLTRFLTAWCLLFNLRNVNTSWTIKGLPNFSSSGPGRVPSKGEFVKRRTAQIIITYLTLDALFAFLPAPNPLVDVPEHKQLLFSRIGDVTLEEAIARPFTVILPALSVYGIFSIPYSILSIVAVVFCRGEPRDWPPLFGSVRDSYTLRRFWGVTWHQLLRSSLEASTSFLAVKVLRVPPKCRLVSRYLRLHLAFFITALIHLPGMVIIGESPFGIGVPKFFLMQAVGITIESTVLDVWLAVSKIRGNKGSAGRMAKLLGYIWVLAWTAWTGPSFTWIGARGLVPGKDDVVPWSFMKQLFL